MQEEVKGLETVRKVWGIQTAGSWEAETLSESILHPGAQVGSRPRWTHKGTLKDVGFRLQPLSVLPQPSAHIPQRDSLWSFLCAPCAPPTPGWWRAHGVEAASARPGPGHHSHGFLPWGLKHMVGVRHRKRAERGSQGDPRGATSLGLQNPQERPFQGPLPWGWGGFHSTLRTGSPTKARGLRPCDLHVLPFVPVQTLRPHFHF